jgi:ribulose-phosphate 3-epimerase
MSIVIAPSLLSANFLSLEDDLRSVEAAGADLIHLDVMDNHFVPNLTFGPLLIEAVSRGTKLPLDAHLMVENAGSLVEPVVKAGVSMVTVHFEAAPHLDRLLRQIRELGAKAGVALNPATPVELIKPVLPLCDLILLMSVNPGFGGQRFIPYVVDKIRDLKVLADKLNPSLRISVDGGVSPSTAPDIVSAGAEILVVGSAFFGAKDRSSLVGELKKLHR